MSDFRMVSPLLDGYTVDKAVMTQRDRTWYSVKHNASGEVFALKHLSVPASDAQVRALILSGIYSSEQDVLAYYTGLVSDIKRELDLGKKLAETGCFAGPLDYQIVQKTDGIGYDIYILHALQIPLNELINRNGMTHLRAVNLGIDLCDAIIACREAGYLFANLKPDNIFLFPSGKFMLGDLGLVPLQDLEYAGIPEDYIGPFSPPELFDLSGIPNVTLDLYSLGMVLYKIYNGNHGPFEDENTDTAMADKLRLSGKPLPTPIYADYELSGIITKACSYQVAMRYSSPEQLKEALLHYLQRNQIPDSLIVPPLVVDPEPIREEEEPITAEEPLRMVDVAELDAAFRESFAPSSENAGDEVITAPAVEAETTTEEQSAPVATAELQDAPPKEEASIKEEAPVMEATPVIIIPETKEKAQPVAEPTPVKEEPMPAVESAPVQEEVKPAPVKEEAKPAAVPAPVKEEPKAAPAKEEAKPAAVPAPVKEEPKAAPAKEEAKPAAAPAPVKEEPKTAPAKEEAKPAAAPAPAKEEPKTAPAKEEAKPAAVPAPVKEEPKASVAEVPAENKEDPLAANAVTGPKMPTGNLRMSKKGRRSRHRENLVLEIPRDPDETPAPETEHSIPSTILIDTPPASVAEDPIPSTIMVGQSPVALETPKAKKPAEFTIKSDGVDLETGADAEALDIDRLIASVNEVVGPTEDAVPSDPESYALSMHVAPAGSGAGSVYYDPFGEESTDDSTEKSGEKKKPKWVPIALVALLSAMLIGAIVFLLDWYYVSITRLSLVDHSTSAIVVELITSDDQDKFIVTCTDSYGHSYTRSTEGNRHTFVGLNENTAYTIEVAASGYHRLRSSKSHTITVKTPGSTKISDFTAKCGEQKGEVYLTFNSEGPSPETWQYSYTDENGVRSGPFPFENDHFVMISNLEEYVTYTFTIEAPKDLYLSGETSIVYTLYPKVTVTGLRIAEVRGNSATLTWISSEPTPSEWTITCEGGDYSRTISTALTNVTFDGLPDFSRDYVFSLSAPGMNDAETITLPANPTIVENMSAKYQEDGTVIVSWTTPSGISEGLYLTYVPVSEHQLMSSYVGDITDNSVVLNTLIPNTEYKFRLQSSGETVAELYGETTVTFTTLEAETFVDYDIDPTPVFTRESGNLSLWLCPEEEDWDYRDLKYTRNEFSKSERVALCLQINSTSPSEDKVNLLYVVRNENGQVVSYDMSDEFTWDQLWFERRHVNEVPLPKATDSNESVPGKYTVEVYINGKLLLQRGFTIA